MSNQFNHYDPNHAFRHAEAHLAHIDEHQRHGLYRIDPKGERTKLGWNLGVLTAAGIGIATGVTGGLAPLLIYGGGLLGGAIGQATYKDKDK
jgi:hypothetical protein